MIHIGTDAVFFLSGTACGYEESNVVCPNCRTHYTHIHHIGTLVGTDEHEATEAYDGTTASGSTPRRRSAVEIVFSCEQCPEHFALVIQQHKGFNFVEIHQNVGLRTENGLGETS